MRLGAHQEGTKMTRRLAKRRETALQELSDAERDYLLTGFRMPLQHTLEHEADEREAWSLHRGELLQEYAEKNGPFRRPFSWWKWQAPEPRHQIAAGPIAPLKDTAYFWGIPGFSQPPYPPFAPKFESTRAYLVRLALPLTPEERVAIRKSVDEFEEGVYPGQEERSAEDWRRWTDSLLSDGARITEQTNVVKSNHPE